VASDLEKNKELVSSKLNENRIFTGGVLWGLGYVAGFPLNFRG